MNCCMLGPDQSLVSESMSMLMCITLPQLCDHYTGMSCRLHGPDQNLMVSYSAKLQLLDSLTG